VETVRELLLQKRVSLTHTPDIIRVLEREQQVSRLQGQHEFQKVKNELKRVEDSETTSGRRFSQLSLGSRQAAGMTDMSSSASSSNHEEEHDVMRRSNSKDLILDLVPAPVQAIEVAKEEAKVETKIENKTEKKMEKKMEKKAETKMENKEVKSRKAVKKERSQTAMISDVLSSSSRIKSLKQSGEKSDPDGKTKNKKPEIGNSIKSNASKKNGNLESPGLLAHINGVKSARSGGGVSGAEKVGTVRSRSISPAKKAATEKGDKKTGEKSLCSCQTSKFQAQRQNCFER